MLVGGLMLLAMNDPRQPYPQQPQQYGQQPPPYGQQPYGQPPQYQQQAPYYAPQQPLQVQMTQTAVSQGQMGYGQAAFHWSMIVMTCGLWWPVYASAKRKRRTITSYR